jgi:hypothetical protein
VDAKFEAILNSLPAKEPRSRLEPYSELITEMRKRGHSYPRNHAGTQESLWPQGWHEYGERLRTRTVEIKSEAVCFAVRDNRD